MLTIKVAQGTFNDVLELMGEAFEASQTANVAVAIKSYRAFMYDSTVEAHLLAKETFQAEREYLAARARASQNG